MGAISSWHPLPRQEVDPVFLTELNRLQVEAKVPDQGSWSSGRGAATTSRVIHMGMVGGEVPGLLHGFQGLRALEPWGKSGFSTGFPQQAKTALTYRLEGRRSRSATCWRGAENSQGGPGVKPKKGGDVRFSWIYVYLLSIFMCRSHANRGVFVPRGRRRGEVVRRRAVREGSARRDLRPRTRCFQPLAPG